MSPEELDNILIPKKVAFPKLEYTCHYKVFCLDSEANTKELEVLMTEILNGKLQLLKEEGTFTKDGQYLLMLKWADFKEVNCG